MKFFGNLRQTGVAPEACVATSNRIFQLSRKVTEPPGGPIFLSKAVEDRGTENKRNAIVLRDGVELSVSGGNGCSVSSCSGVSFFSFTYDLAEFRLEG